MPALSAATTSEKFSCNLGKKKKMNISKKKKRKKKKTQTLLKYNLRRQVFVCTNLDVARSHANTPWLSKYCYSCFKKKVFQKNEKSGFWCIKVYLWDCTEGVCVHSEYRSHDTATNYIVHHVSFLHACCVKSAVRWDKKERERERGWLERRKTMTIRAKPARVCASSNVCNWI